MSKEVAQGLVIAATSALLGLGVYLLARRQLLSFRYAAGWLALFGLGALSSALLSAAEPLASLIEVTPGIVVSAGAVLALLGICVQLSISISGLQEQVRTLSEEIALHRVTCDDHVRQR